MTTHDLEHSNTTPYARIISRDSAPLFISFCSVICIIYNKKLNLANIFLLLLKEKPVLTLYIDMCEFDSKYDALRSFLEYDCTLHKSKYIKKYLNSRNLYSKKYDRSRKENI